MFDIYQICNNILNVFVVCAGPHIIHQYLQFNIYQYGNNFACNGDYSNVQ